MNTIEQKFLDEIDIERLWVTTKQGGYMFFSMVPISALMIFGLWDTAAHKLLLEWFSLLTAINFFRWRVLRFYYRHKDVLIADTRKFKRLMLQGRQEFRALGNRQRGPQFFQLFIARNPRNGIFIIHDSCLLIIDFNFVGLHYFDNVRAHHPPALSRFVFMRVKVHVTHFRNPKPCSDAQPLGKIHIFPE